MFRRRIGIFELYDFPTEIVADDSSIRSLLERLCADYPDFSLPASNPTTYDCPGRLIESVTRYAHISYRSRLHLRGLLYILFSHILAVSVPRKWAEDSCLARAFNFINQHIGERLDIREVAEKACMSTPYFIRRFKGGFGIPPLQYINRKKIEKAQIMLISDRLTVKEISYSLGFADYSYFIRLFKKYTGHSPLRYRRMTT